MDQKPKDNQVKLIVSAIVIFTIIYVIITVMH